MSSNVKKMINEGWAISEHKMLRKLGEYAEQGWILKRMNFLYFIMEKGEPEEIQYSMNYQPDIEDLEEYKNIFKEAGWEYVCNFTDFYIFKAKRGTCPIHTDLELLKELRKKEKKESLLLMLFSFLGMVIGFKLNFLTRSISILSVITFIIGLIGAMLFGMSLVLNFGWFFREGK